MSNEQLSIENYQLPEGYQQTEVGVIPEDWSVTSLGEIGQSFIGLTYRPEDTRDYGTLVLRSSNVQNDRLAYENNVYVDNALPLPSRVIVEEGDILICVRNGSKQLIGKCALIDAGAAGSAFGAFMSIFRTKLSGFVFYQFQSDVIQRQINEIMGATINQITNKDLVAFQIPIPPLQKEQRSIAQALSDVDRLLAALEKAIAKKRAIKTATMQQLLTGKKRLPGFGEGKGYKESEVGVIPADWNVRVLNEMCTKIQDGTHFSPKLGGNDFYYITSKNIGRGFLNLSNAERIDTAQHEAIYKRCDVRKGDLLLTKDGVNTGNVALNDLNEEFSLLSSVALLRFEPTSYEPAYFLHLILSSESQNRLKDLVSGNAITRLTLEKIRKIPFPFPLLEEQRAIATVLSDMDAAIAALETRFAKTQSIKQGMMQTLLTGRVRLV